MHAIANRYEFVYLFDVTNGNPNGDPDAGNLPRLDPETNQGLVTDVCLKRKLRNYVTLEKGGEPGYAIYMQERSVLNEQHSKAYEALDIEPVSKKLPRDQAQAQELTAWMCRNFFDVRAFGAVMTTEVNCGQVRGPVQLAFASSIEPIVPLEVSITRMAVTNERDLEKERTMGRKHLVPYGLYRAHGFISAKLGERTGFSEDDLELLWRALINMFEHDRSAARGEMAARKLITFRHDNPMGNAPAHTLFDRVVVERSGDDSGPARSFHDYHVQVLRDGLPDGVAVEERL
ncbi:MAG: type I-C CRISPR-associated protein Cas7/Csd2 [Ectothiorhodospiraceae bacterium]|nr:type I-C CRISPR-associated protein Cas7/Csd2 [Ectothiorhodospiraceae bacterium]